MKVPQKHTIAIIIALKREPPMLHQKENHAKVLAYSAPFITRIIPTPIVKGNIVQQLTD